MSQNQIGTFQGLGTLLHHHKASKKAHFRRFFLLAMIAIIFLAAIIIVFSTADNVNIGAGLLLILMLLTVFIAIAAFFLFYLKCELCLYEFGAVEQFGIWRYSARYQDIQVWHGVMGFSKDPRKNNHGYSVKFPDSSRHLMFYFDSRFNETADYLMKMVCDAQMPELLARFNAGESIKFDKITINQESLEVNSNTFLWSEDYYVKLNRGVFTIKRDKQSRTNNTATIQYLEIPNILIFQSLLQSINKLS